jgi:hypothetical protein
LKLQKFTILKKQLKFKRHLFSFLLVRTVLLNTKALFLFSLPLSIDYFEGGFLG